FLLFFFTNYIDNTFSLLSSYISGIEDALKEENFEKAAKLSASLRKKLRSKSEILYYVSDRAPIDNAITECERLLSFIETKDKSEAYASAMGIAVILEKTKEKSLFSLP
ncbi:MAG: DUF4363 family protein, partial [Clostridia bacterium]|nr:DUF4363 family protein [Clostridia bacterium]